jgi:hypothetical protein
VKILRSVTHRGSSVGAAGYFTVLRANRWFAASLFPDRFPHLHERVEAALREPAQDQKFSNAPDNQSPIHLELNPPPEPLHLIRSALIALVAIGITVFLLWWVFVVAPRHPRNYTENLTSWNARFGDSSQIVEFGENDQQCGEYKAVNKGA